MPVLALPGLEPKKLQDSTHVPNIPLMKILADIVWPAAESQAPKALRLRTLAFGYGKQMTAIKEQSNKIMMVMVMMITVSILYA